MQANRQTIVQGMRVGLIVLLIGGNVAALWLARAVRLEVLIPSVLAIPAFHLLLAHWWEPLRLAGRIRRGGETPLVRPHFAWNMRRDSRREWSTIAGAVALTDHAVHFVSSPFYDLEPVTLAIPLSQIIRVTASEREENAGHYLVMTLRDGAVLKLKMRSRSQRARWANALSERVRQ